MNWVVEVTAEGDGVYTVRLRRIKGKPVLFFQESMETVAAATLRWERWIYMLEHLGFLRIEDRVWTTESSTAFISALVFFSVAQTFRKPGMIERLKHVVEDLELLELRFWGNAIVRGYRASGRLGIYRPARSFKVLYGLAR